MRLLSWIIKGSIGTFRVLYFLLAVVVILVAAYVLGGYAFLVERGWGTDMGSAFAMAVWIDKYFPRVPFWYPLAGGGVSITHSYPVFSFYLVAILKRTTDLDLIQAFRVLGFSSVPLMALGIYAFVSLRFKNQTAALIASILYLISPIAWVWLFDWGFYAEVVSHMFVMPAIIFWDLFFTSFLDDVARIRNRMYLALTVIFLSLTLLAHFGSGFGLIGFFVFYLIGYAVKRREKRKVFVRGVLALSLVGILTLLATAFTTFPFYRYTKIAAEAGLSGGLSYEQFKVSELPIGEVLGFQIIFKEGELSATRHISFPAVLSLFAILGALLSFQSARYLTFAIFAIYALTLSINANFLFWMSHHVPVFLAAAFGKRCTLILLRFILPTLAALGAIEIFKIPLFWVRGRFGGFVKGVFASLAGLGLVAFALYQFGYLPRPRGLPSNYDYGAQGIDLRNIWRESKSYRLPGKEGRINVGQDVCLGENWCLYLGDTECLKAFEAEGKKEWCHSPLYSHFLPLGVQEWCQRAEAEQIVLPELCYPDRLTEEKVKSFWQGCREDAGFSDLCGLRFKSLDEQLSPSEWPQFEIRESFNAPEKLEQILQRISSESPSARIDFSPYTSSISMIAPYYNVDRSLSQIHIYAAPSSLILRFWGEQSAAFYLNSPYYGEDPNLINNLARWFGINYIFFGEHTDTQLFQQAGWEVFIGSWASGVLKFPEENSLADLSEKPTVLVIGQNKAEAYDQVFRLASYGALPYKNTLSVRGKGRIDSYELSELSQFDLLVLHGYTYKNRQKANNLLTEYVRGGGRVFIDTGWQYTTPDWETGSRSEALDVIPLRKLSWKDLGKTSDFVLEDNELGSGVDVSRFAPLIYEDQPWNVSTSEKSELRDWAKVVLSAKDYPLVVAGELGEGRVVWSGMNIFPHTKQGTDIYYEEIKLLTNLFSWLTEGASVDNFAVSYTRDHPDKVEFTVGKAVPKGGFLLWKEAYHPDFHASLTSNLEPKTQNLDVYRAGPGFALIKVPELRAGDKIVYEYRLPLVEKTSLAISFLAILFLPVIVVEGAFLKERSLFLQTVQTLEGKLHYLFFELWKKPLSWWEKGKEEDEY